MGIHPGLYLLSTTLQIEPIVAHLGVLNTHENMFFRDSTPQE